MSEEITNKLYNAITNIDEEMIEKAQFAKAKKTKVWMKWGEMAACLCLVLAGATTVWLSVKSNQETVTPATVYSLEQTDQMSVKLVSWQDEGFKGIVTNADEQNIFPEGAELTVIFEDETEIILEDGTFFDYSYDEPQAGLVGWEEGTIVQVEFRCYEQYQADNGYYNRLYASSAKTESNDLLYREYNAGFDIDSADGKASIQWNLPADVMVDRIYLYCFTDHSNRELTEEEIAEKTVTIAETGHYLLYGMDDSGNVVDFTEYLSYGSETEYIEGETPFIPL